MWVSSAPEDKYEQIYRPCHDMTWTAWVSSTSQISFSIRESQPAYVGLDHLELLHIVAENCSEIILFTVSESWRSFPLNCSFIYTNLFMCQTVVWTVSFVFPAMKQIANDIVNGLKRQSVYSWWLPLFHFYQHITCFNFNKGLRRFRCPPALTDPPGRLTLSKAVM